MMSLLYCLLAPAAPPEEILNRYVALRRQAPAVEMTFQSSGLKGLLLLHPGDRLRYEAKGPNTDYLCVITSSGMRDIDRQEHEYDEVLGVRLGAPPSRISNASRAFPMWVMPPDLRKMFPETAKYTSLGSRTVNGVTGDVVRGTFGDPQGGDHLFEAVIDAKGAPRYLLAEGKTQMGRYRMEWTIDVFRPIPVPPPSKFTFSIPDGYSPYSLDLVYGPTGVGSNLPLDGWRTPAGGRFDLKGRMAKGGLIAVWNVDSEPSRRSAAALAKIRAAGVSVAILSDATDSAGAKGMDGYDPSGKQIAKFDVPSTPAFFKVDASGKVTAVWLGFDPAKADEFVNEAIGR